MKTAVSLPDGIFSEAERAASEAGISRSELYARAIKTYLDASRNDRLTQDLDDFYGSLVQEPDPYLRRAAEIASGKIDS